MPEKKKKVPQFRGGIRASKNVVGQGAAGRAADKIVERKEANRSALKTAQNVLLRQRNAQTTDSNN